MPLTYERIMTRFCKKTFPFWQKLGFSLIPNHYYEPIPDPKVLTDKLWDTHSELVGIDMREPEQLAMLAEFNRCYRAEYEQFPRQATNQPSQYYVNNGAFETVDGEILYCMVRHLKPKRIFEIGSGHSTCLSAQAVLKNQSEGHPCELVAIDPYAKQLMLDGFPGLSKVKPVAVQDVPLEYFSELGENDILFIDSSHMLKLGSDVKFEFLELVPRLPRGVVVHVHDIFLPAEYRKEWILRDHKFWNEQYILQAFLAFNESFQILWGGSFMHLRHARELAAAFASYKDRPGAWPGSFWMKKIK